MRMLTKCPGRPQGQRGGARSHRLVALPGRLGGCLRERDGGGGLSAVAVMHGCDAVAAIQGCRQVQPAAPGRRRSAAPGSIIGGARLVRWAFRRPGELAGRQRSHMAGSARPTGSRKAAATIASAGARRNADTVGGGASCGPSSWRAIRTARPRVATSGQPRSTTSSHGGAAGPTIQATFKAYANLATVARPPSKTNGGGRGGSFPRSGRE